VIVNSSYLQFMTARELCNFQAGDGAMTTTDHETNIRDKAQALHDAIRDAEGAGYRVTYPGSLHDLPAIAISETGRVSQQDVGDGLDNLDKTGLQKLAEGRGLSTKGTVSELIERLRAPPQPDTPVPKGTTTLVP
jgi:hypothetical protein